MRKKTIVIKVYGRTDPRLDQRRQRRPARKLRNPFQGPVQVSVKPACAL